MDDICCQYSVNIKTIKSVFSLWIKMTLQKWERFAHRDTKVFKTLLYRHIFNNKLTGINYIKNMLFFNSEVLYCYITLNYETEVINTNIYHSQSSHICSNRKTFELFKVLLSVLSTCKIIFYCKSCVLIHIYFIITTMCLACVNAKTPSATCSV